jgi:hypothetical protein
MFNEDDLNKWKNSKPFNHLVIDNFLENSLAMQIADEFPSINDDFWFYYNNAVEVKKACDMWCKFPKSIYKTIFELTSKEFVDSLSNLVGKQVWADYGLNGGGIHAMGNSGKLNPHLDYNIHPKLGLQRKINLIIYLTKDWDTSWGGAIELWSHDEENNKPKQVEVKIDCTFNRALLFDTTQNSWHGISDQITCPIDKSRNSIAIYYVCEPDIGSEDRNKALFAPTEDQKGDKLVEELIKQRLLGKYKI